MGCLPNSPFLQRLGGRINLESIPFSDRGSRLLVFRRSSRLSVRLAERWFKWEDEVGHYRQRPPMVDDLVVTDENGNPVDFTLSAFPHAVCIGTPLGDLWLAFEDEETLYFDLPRGRLGLAFRVYATRGIPIGAAASSKGIQSTGVRTGTSLTQQTRVFFRTPSILTQMATNKCAYNWMPRKA